MLQGPGTLHDAYFDGTVVSLLDCIFRGHSDIPVASKTSYYILGIYGSDTYNGWGMVAKPGSDLTDLMPNVMQALYALLSADSLLTKMDLHKLINVPGSLLCSPTITSLDLNHVEFTTKRSTSITPPRLTLPKLKNVDLNFSPTFSTVVSESSEYVLPIVENASSFIRDNEDLRVLDCLGRTLTTLRLGISLAISMNIYLFEI